MIRIHRGKYTLVVEDDLAQMVKNSDGSIVLTASNPQAIEALIDCFSDIKEQHKELA